MKCKGIIGTDESDAIFVHGYYFTEDLIGNLTLAEKAFLGALYRRPTDEELLYVNTALHHALFPLV
jgi:citrate synthase